jgi:transcriptional regulator with XRE-family HTH domain
MDVAPTNPQMTLGAFLRIHRLRIPPETSALGLSNRLPSRRGRRVTQEELAEEVDVSRGWYRMLESGARVRTSMQLLERLSDALMLTYDERIRLFALAMPEMRRAGLRAEASAVLEAFSSLRRIARRLWSATTELEALTIVSEDGALRFDRPDVVLVTARAAPGLWTLPVVLANTDGIRRTETLLSECASALGPSQVDDLMSYGFINEPGKVGVRSELPYEESVDEPFRRALEQVKWPDLGVMFSHIRTRHGFAAQFTVMHSDGRDYSETDRATLSVLASLTSLALN